MSLGGSSQIHPAGGEDEADAEPADAASAPALSPDARARRSMELYEETQAKYAVSTEEKAALEREEIEAIVEAMAQRVKQPYFLLLPESKYIQRWDLVTLGALIFTAFVTPYEVALLQTKYDGLFFVNRLVDFVFFKDMVMQFFLAFRDTDPRNGGFTLVKSLSKARATPRATPRARPRARDPRPRSRRARARARTSRARRHPLSPSFPANRFPRAVPDEPAAPRARARRSGDGTCGAGSSSTCSRSCPSTSSARR